MILSLVRLNILRINIGLLRRVSVMKLSVVDLYLKCSLNIVRYVVIMYISLSVFRLLGPMIKFRRVYQ